MNVYYLTYEGKYVQTLDSANFIRVVTLPDSGSALYNVLEYYKNGKNKFIGKSSKIDPPSFEGQCVTFYENGHRQSSYTYKDNKRSGNAYEYYTNGKIYRSIVYPENIDADSLMGNNYLILANADSLGNRQVEDGEGYYKGFNTKFQYIDEQGWVKNSKRDSIWKGKDINRKITFEEIYKAGKFVRGVATDSMGAHYSYYGSRATLPQFTGGSIAFNNYLTANIHYPYYERENNIQGVVVLSFVVEKDGHIKNIKVNRSVSKSLDNEAIRVIKKSPLWKPGTLYGKPSSVFFTIPINFALQ